jgi:hypothetical protein
MRRSSFVALAVGYLSLMGTVLVASQENIITTAEARNMALCIWVCFMGLIVLSHIISNKRRVKSLKMEFTVFEENMYRVEGIVNEGEFTFSARLFDDTTVIGIDGGRIGELKIVAGNDSWKRSIAEYKRGWIKKPKSLHHKRVCETVQEFLEVAPKTRFE